MGSGVARAIVDDDYTRDALCWTIGVIQVEQILCLPMHLLQTPWLPPHAVVFSRSPLASGIVTMNRNNSPAILPTLNCLTALGFNRPL